MLKTYQFLVFAQKLTDYSCTLHLLIRERNTAVLPFNRVSKKERDVVS